MQQRNILWPVVNELTKAFDLPDPREHDFLKIQKKWMMMALVICSHVMKKA